MEDVQRVTIQVGERRWVVDLCPRDRKPIDDLIKKLPPPPGTRRGRRTPKVFDTPEDAARG